MVIAAFIIASFAIILALGAFQGARKAQDEKVRLLAERELAAFLTDVHVPDPAHAHGRLGDAEVHLHLGHHEIDYTVKLPNAMVPFRTLLDRFGPRGLHQKLAECLIEVGEDDIARGSVPREPGLGETLVTVGKRLELVQRVIALRTHAPEVLVERLHKAHGSKDVDEILLALAWTYPEAPETEQAIQYAAHLEHSHPERIRERARQWLVAGRQPAFPVR